MCVVREDFERNGIYVLSIIVLREMKLDQIRAFEWLPIYWVCAMLLDPW